jgi:hypothetical protein
MANILNEEKKPEAPAEKTYSEADLRAAQAETQMRMLAERNRELQQEAFRQRNPAPQGPDPLYIQASEGLAKPVDEQVRLMDAGIRNRIRSEVGPALAQMQTEQQQREERTRQEIAVSTIFATNPDMASDQEGYYAAYAKATFRANQRGVPLDGAALARDAASIYRADHKAPTPDPPVLEGSSRPDAPGGGVPKAPEKPKGPSLYEKWYGKADDDVLHEEEHDPNSEAAIQEYVDERMQQPEEHVYGVSKSIGLSKVRGVQAEESRRTARRRAATNA